MKRFIYSLINIVGWVLLIGSAFIVLRSVTENYQTSIYPSQANTLLMLLALAWGFVGGKAQDFSYVRGQAYFRPKHCLALLVLTYTFWPAVMSMQDLMLPGLFLLFAFETHRSTKKIGLPAFNWTHTINKRFEQKEIEDVLKQKLTVIDVVKNKDHITVRARFLLVSDIQVDIFQDRTVIRVLPQQTSFSFILGLHILPIPAGRCFGKEILVALGEYKPATPITIKDL